MKRRTVLKSAALVPVIALPVAAIRKPGHMQIVDQVATFYDDYGVEIARVEKNGRVVREPGVINRCARYFWDAMAGDADVRLVGRNWPLKVVLYNFSDPAWSVEMPANGSVREMRFENVDGPARYFWIVIQARRPKALTWS